MITLTLTLGKDSIQYNIQFNSLLKDELFAEEINDVIKAVVEEHAALPYIRELLSNIPKYDIQFVISDQLSLDVLLMKIRSKTIYYATVMEWSGVDYRTQTAESVKNGDHSRRRRQSGFILQQQTIFSTPKILTRTHR